jgi:hypothetical protein
MRPIPLIGLAILSATSAVANVGDSIEESLHRLRISHRSFASTSRP